MNPDSTGKRIEILLVEDNPGDARLMVEAFKESKILNNIHIVKDGVETLAFLRREGKYTDVPRPNLLLLDLNLPKMNGIALLREIKTDMKLKHIPVVILTTSKADEDIIKCYNAYANCYITKPVDLNDFINIVKLIIEFWLAIVKLPGSDVNDRTAY